MNNTSIDPVFFSSPFSFFVFKTTEASNMALAQTDCKQYRATNSEIPLDIFFQVLPSKSTRDRNIEMEEEEEVDKTNMIGAHKLLLAGASPVFRANFFGPMRMAQ